MIVMHFSNRFLPMMAFALHLMQLIHMKCTQIGKVMTYIAFKIEQIKQFFFKFLFCLLRNNTIEYEIQ